MKVQAKPSKPLPLFSYLFGDADLAGKKIVDLFAGGGGVSLGIEQALGRSPDVAINHDEEAIAMHQANHPYTTHFRSDIFEVDPVEATGGCPVALLWLSPDCKHHSRAKGGRPLDQNIRSLAWVGMKWAGKVKPDVIILENVPDFVHWGRLVADRGVMELQPDTVQNGKVEKGKWKKVKLPWPNKPKRNSKATYRRWKKGMPAQKPPRGPVLRDQDGATLLVADKSPRYRGRIFRQYVKQLKALGYTVEYGTLRADQFGVPTIRERFFLIARRDGKAIHWPQPTHGEGLLPVRTAAECIDWSIPTRTIFEQHARRRADLKPNTLRRIAKGMDKFVLGERRPFLVTCNHAGEQFRGQGLDEPMRTITSASDAHGVVNPYMVQTAHGGHNIRQRDAQQPLGTVTANDKPSVVTPFFAPMSFDNHAAPVTDPLQVITTQGNKNTLITPYLAPRYGEAEGQAPRCGTVEAPLPTITTGANGARLVAAHVTKYRQHSVGSSVDAPLDTICAGGNTDHPGGSSIYGVVAAHLTKHYGGGNKDEHASIGLNGPAGTITTADHHALVAASLVQYNGTADAQALDKPSQTMSTVERFGLATAYLTTYYGDKKVTGDVRGADLRFPIRTIPTGNRHGMVTAFIAQHQGQSDARPASEPLSGLTSGAVHHAVVAAHVLRQFGSNDGRSLVEPLGSQTAVLKDGLVTTHLLPVLTPELLSGAHRVYRCMAEFCPEALAKVPAEDLAQELITLVIDGEKFVIYDIGMRMLEPRELYRCQGFPDSYLIDFSVKGKPLPKNAQVRMCGNSVPPGLVSAIVGAQFAQPMREAAD
ncbi:DNA cytosine methyltransferase (plasmid) [Deinococcus sp. KNUC1210]|uniref:DNA cytosine methyltransferase n=1 Tax=Deinococcus sp. KNUC1210 TaxID=2917691 RepID=UPI001EF083FD|nr:DNA cytosine methyltransferase [Deinococcus sp. KNUC1210]ULH17421.1 DNA cytosine methyltransferase [Deinococcus sp. KNUC1210]